MFWWFEREGAFRRCEVLQLSDDEYELRIEVEDGTERVERYRDPISLSDRQQKVMNDLAADGWSWVI